MSFPEPLAELLIDLSAIRDNVAQLVRVAAPAQVMAIVKADGYNHGAAQVAQAALEGGAHQLGVATLAEAVRLRGEGVTCPITAWMWFPGEDLAPAFDAQVTVGVPSLAHAKFLFDAAAEHPHTTPRVALMVDTGLSRSGVSRFELSEVIQLLAEHQDVLEVTGAFSHLASADMDAGQEVTDLQAQRFQEAIDQARAAGLAMPCNHLANTPATLNRKDVHHQMVRPGVSVYGVDPLETRSDVNLRGAMTLRARVVTTRVVPKGEGVSYGLTWRAQQDTRTAVVALGYADGIPRAASGRFEVAINGRRYPQIGRVCMDQFVVALPEDADVQPGDWAVVFGAGGPSVDEFAAAAETIAYEILTLPRGPRVARKLMVPTADEMRAAGERIGRTLQPGTVVVLTGPLGAGKTTLTQGIAAGLGVKGRVQSPTFTIVRSHKPGETGGPGMLHMDAYRLLGQDVSEGLEPGLHVDRNMVLDALESLDIDADIDDVVVVAEWGRGVVETLSDKVLDIQIERGADSDIRTLSMQWLHNISPQKE